MDKPVCVLRVSVNVRGRRWMKKRKRACARARENARVREWSVCGRETERASERTRERVCERKTVSAIGRLKKTRRKRVTARQKDRE